MLNNLVNSNDLKRLARGIFTVRGLVSLGQAMERRDDRIEKAWEHTESPPSNWWDIAEVRNRWNLLVSGDAELGFAEYASAKHLAEMQDLTALSLGCGTGHNELDWARLGKFQKLEGIDVSWQRISAAQQAAVSENLDSILQFRTVDIHDLNIVDGSYDVILAIQAMHHFSPLRPLLTKVSRLLKPNGLLLVNEFVGPDRFQWTVRQMEAVNALLTILPPRLRIEWGGKKVKERVVRPSRLSMILSDPSESVESSHILPLLHELFDVVEVRNYGGTLLHMLLQGIAHNFKSDDPEAQRYLRLFFEAEDLMMQSGEIRSDFAVVVCRQRGKPDAQFPYCAELSSAEDIETVRSSLPR